MTAFLRYPLSLRVVEDLLFERGIDVSLRAVRFWHIRFGPMYAAELGKRRHMAALAEWRPLAASTSPPSHIGQLRFG